MTDAPRPITLDSRNSVEILYSLVELAQANATFELGEADVLKRSRDVLLNGINDPEISRSNARQFLITAINRGQKKGGAFNLEQASLAFRICKYISDNMDAPVPTVSSQPDNSVTTESPPRPIEPTAIISGSSQTSQGSLPVIPEQDDLSELSDPVPLNLKSI